MLLRNNDGRGKKLHQQGLILAIVEFQGKAIRNDIFYTIFINRKHLKEIFRNSEIKLVK